MNDDRKDVTDDSKDFEAFVAEWTGRDMAYHAAAGTWGLEFARACWQAARRLSSAPAQPVAHDEHDQGIINGFWPSMLAIGALREAALPNEPHSVNPIDMVLHCPKCGAQHIDEPEVHAVKVEDLHVDDVVLWDNPPHRSHLCHGCGHIWRPADVPTNGVAAVKTKGKDDSPIVNRGSGQQAGAGGAG